MIYFEVSQNNMFSQSLGTLPACEPIAHEELEKVRAHSGDLYTSWSRAKTAASSVCSFFRDYYKLPYVFHVNFYDEDGTFLTSYNL
ncbi:MAG: hypothetical protein IIY21_03115 [Clostridiales bacterium]|nr:hypothetical protein [Clostridiales bacterium]MBQ1570304.1 hypothetical protein [Clostridiales bacterium]